MQSVHAKNKCTVRKLAQTLLKYCLLLLNSSVHPYLFLMRVGSQSRHTILHTQGTIEY